MANNGGEITSALKDDVVFSAPRFSDSPNARSKTITTATGSDTFGTLNQHLQNNLAYQIGVHDDKGQRRTMEDAYSFVTDFGSVRGQGYFAVFDGHAGKYAAEWCGQHFHEHLLDEIRNKPDDKIPDILNQTFHSVDSKLSEIAQKDDKMHSGCTAVTAFLRVEDKDGRQSFLPQDFYTLKDTDAPIRSESPRPGNVVEDASASGRSSPLLKNTDENSKKRKSNGGASKLKSTFKSVSDTLKGNPASNCNSNDDDATSSNSYNAGSQQAVFAPPTTGDLRRVLYTANAGDARAVLCRAGKAIRLTYDHKGTDKQEAKRIMDAGGFVLSGRVNGVLAVTRSLGDSSMKEFVVGSPYTTETQLSNDDEFLILACDGLWDVATDQEAVDMIREITDAQEASRKLVEHALHESTDNITVLVIRFPSAAAPLPSGPSS